MWSYFWPLKYFLGSFLKTAKCNVDINGEKVSTKYVYSKNGDKCKVAETIVTMLPSGTVYKLGQ